VAALALALAGCSRQEPPGAGGDEEPVSSVVVVASSAAPARSPAPSASAAPSPPREGELPIGPEYEVAAEGAPLVAAIARPVWIHDGPEFSFKRLGYLHPGMTLRRAEKPVAKGPRCRGGWFRVAPRGFLCMNGEVTGDLTNPIVVAYAHQARRGEPLPYAYGRVRNHLAARYAKAPTPYEQRSAEGDDLGEHLAGASRLHQILAAGQPEPLPPFLAAGQILPKAQNVTHRARHGAHRGFGSAHSSFAFFAVYDIQNRLFGLSTELDLVPLDRLNLATVSKIHGGPIADLPAGSARAPTPRFRLDGGRLVQDGMFEAHETVALTGNSQNDLLETQEGTWIHGKALYLFRKRSSWPGFLKEGNEMKWIDVSLRDQTLVAYEGRRAAFVARVSTGAGGEGDPETTHATIKGMYRIQSKHVTATMSGDRAEGNDYSLADVPYVQYFHHDYALHAAYWHEKFGTPRSHGCINLSPLDAAWIFEWTDAPLPPEWHGIETHGEGTLVFIH
jgi:hypothetical protein